jgi:hypothetical protein
MGDALRRPASAGALADEGRGNASPLRIADAATSIPHPHIASRRILDRSKKAAARLSIETRTYAASSKVDWITSERSYPGQPRFKNIKTILKVHARAEYADRCSFETHYHISSPTRVVYAEN